MKKKKQAKIVVAKEAILEWYSQQRSQQVNTVVMSIAQIERHPSFKVLDDNEKKIFLLARQGFSYRRIAKMLELNPPEVCRTIREIMRRFEYLVRFREYLLGNDKARRQFLREFWEYEERNCGEMA